MARDRYEQLLHTKPGKLSIEAMTTGPGNKRVFKVDLSKNEYIAGREERELDDYAIYVYSPEMIVVEKLRAICQQMPAYADSAPTAARARDFFDIYKTVTKRKIDLTSEANRELLRLIFDAKRVPLALLRQVESTREFHRPDWLDVETTAAAGHVEDFDFYFNFVLEQIEKLKALGVV
jgi:hypothetical protein